MKFEGFDWDRGNREKCRSTVCRWRTSKSVFGNPVVILPDKDNPAGEPRFRAIGRTASGRAAFIVFTMRGTASAQLRPISARFMHKKEVRAYEEAYPDL